MSAKVAEAITPDGGRLELYEHQGSFCLRLDGRQLVHSAAAVSELLLGRLGTEGLASRAGARILVGGLGLGFTLKGVLENVRLDAWVQVAELLAEVVQWNRQFMSGLNATLLEDARVAVIVADVWDLLIRAPVSSYDAVLLDVDNGPQALVQKQNSRLYDPKGLAQLASVLKPGGRAVFWSADAIPNFAERLVRAGFSVKSLEVRFYAAAERCEGTIFVADRQPLFRSSTNCCNMLQTSS